MGTERATTTREAAPRTSKRCIGLAGGSVACGARRRLAVRAGLAAVGRAGRYRTWLCAEKVRHAVHARCQQQATADKEPQAEHEVGSGDSKLSLCSPSLLLGPAVVLLRRTHAETHRWTCRTASMRSISSEERWRAAALGRPGPRLLGRRHRRGCGAGGHTRIACCERRANGHRNILRLTRRRAFLGV